MKKRTARKEVAVAYFKDPQWLLPERTEKQERTRLQEQMPSVGTRTWHCRNTKSDVTTDCCRGTENSCDASIRVRSTAAKKRIGNFWNKSQSVYDVSEKLYYGRSHLVKYK